MLPCQETLLHTISYSYKDHYVGLELYCKKIREIAAVKIDLDKENYPEYGLDWAVKQICDNCHIVK